MPNVFWFALGICAVCLCIGWVLDGLMYKAGVDDDD